MKISFVIPAHNEENYIGDCLDSILREKKDAPCDVEVIVVDNASIDSTAAVVEKYGWVRLVREPEKGIVKARRAGFAVSTGDLIANVDSDSRLTPGWIKTVCDEFSKDPKLVGLSGPFRYYDLPEKMARSIRRFYYIAFCFYLINRFILHIGSMLQGGNFVVRRDALEKIGGYDTNVEFYGEDTNIARRLYRVGRVKFTFKLPMYSSGRRLAQEGAWTMAWRYGINYFWMTFFGRPFTKSSTDIRLQNKNNPYYAPTNRAKELGIKTAAIIFFFAVVCALCYGVYALALVLMSK
ncbi:MAG: glycosyltransferase family 2 protein [Patescibacteria group bacterium]|nr:glycosyltransferase family 2 protein [Patescibacteria group bacterium]